MRIYITNSICLDKWKICKRFTCLRQYLLHFRRSFPNKNTRTLPLMKTLNPYINVFVPLCILIFWLLFLCRYDYVLLIFLMVDFFPLIDAAYTFFCMTICFDYCFCVTLYIFFWYSEWWHFLILIDFVYPFFCMTNYVLITSK